MGFIGLQPASALLTSADIQDGQITTTKIADTAVTTAKITDDAVTGSKIENSPTIANGLTLTDGDISVASGHGLNVDSLKILEVSTLSYGNDTNKSVNTAYDFTHTLAAGTWLPFLKFTAAFFENHGNSNSTGIYYPFTYLGSSSGGEQYGFHYTVAPKWGNASNSYNTMSHSAIPPFTISSSSTIYVRWYVIEYGTSSNHWVRNSGNQIIFLRIG